VILFDAPDPGCTIVDLILWMFTGFVSVRCEESDDSETDRTDDH